MSVADFPSTLRSRREKPRLPGEKPRLPAQRRLAQPRMWRARAESPPPAYDGQLGGFSGWAEAEPKSSLARGGVSASASALATSAEASRRQWSPPLRESALASDSPPWRPPGAAPAPARGSSAPSSQPRHPRSWLHASGRLPDGGQAELGFGVGAPGSWGHGAHRYEAQNSLNHISY